MCIGRHIDAFDGWEGSSTFTNREQGFGADLNRERKGVEIERRAKSERGARGDGAEIGEG